MKRTLFLIGSLLVLAGCVKEAEETGLDGRDDKTVTIRVSVPEEPYSRVSFTLDEGKLKVAWQDDDCIRVISDQGSEVFTISRIISDHEAEFTGSAVAGTRFDILYPGTYESVEAAEDDTVTPTQDGNGSTAHLRFRALLQGVDDYREISFSKAWAEEHQATFRQGAAVRVVALLPEGVSTLGKVGIGLGDRIYSLPLEHVDVSSSAQKLTAYMMLPWEDIDLPDGSTVPLYVMDTDHEVYSRTLSISGNKTIRQGMMNSFGGNTPISGLAMRDFVSGDGSAQNPYLIANTRQLNNMHNSGVLVNNVTKYFRLLEDIDASGIANWVPLNTASDFAKAMDFDGDGHTVSGLTSTGANYASFAGVLNGTIRNVTFDGATVSHNSKVGVVAGSIGTSGVTGSCDNVHVRNSSVSVPSADQWTGGFAAEVNTSGTVSHCSVENTTVTGKAHVAGFVGAVLGEASTFIDCVTRNFTITQQATPSTNRGISGFVGCISLAPATFRDCRVEGAVISATNPLYYIAGFMGYCNASARFEGCSVEGTRLEGTHSMGGFIGFHQWRNQSYFTDCTVTDVTVTQKNGDGGSHPTGGFAGHSEDALTFTRCQVLATVSASTPGIQDMGGFIGLNGGNVYQTVLAGATFKDSRVLAGTTVSGCGSRAGGFAGYIQLAATSDGCVSEAVVTGTGSCHGNFVGYSTGTSTYLNSQASGHVTGGLHTGGFAGYAELSTFVDCTYRDGQVTDPLTDSDVRCGGFVGNAANGLTFNNCQVIHATVSAAGAGRTGGFAGQLGKNLNGGNNVFVRDCKVQDTSVSGANDTGGFVGVQCADVTRSSVSGGSVTAHADDAGGFCASLRNGTLSHSFTTASVSGAAYVGGFAGCVYLAHVTCCYSAGPSVSGSANPGAFAAGCLDALATLTSCIASHATLPFCPAPGSATLTDVYAGTAEVRAKAVEQNWPAGIWNLSQGTLPVLQPSANYRIHVAFIGDSIIWQWTRAGVRLAKSTITSNTGMSLNPLPSYMIQDSDPDYVIVTFHSSYFTGNGYVNKGISGHTTVQMLDRFEKDIVALQPEVVVISGGINDFSRGYTEPSVFNNIKQMAEMAVAGIDGLKGVVICSLTPNTDSCPSSAGATTKDPLIRAANADIQNWIADTSDPNHGKYHFCDFWNALVTDPISDHTLKKAYRLYDALHPGPDGYTVMESVLQPILSDLLSVE